MANAVEAPVLDLEPLVGDVDLELPVALAQRHGFRLGAALDDQRAVLDADGRWALDEGTLSVMSERSADVAADVLSEVAGEPRIGQLGNQHETPVERHRSAEELFAGGRVGEQPLA